MQAIDGALLALTLGATFVARSFSGDKAQLVPIIQAGLPHAQLCPSNDALQKLLEQFR